MLTLFKINVDLWAKQSSTLTYIFSPQAIAVAQSWEDSKQFPPGRICTRNKVVLIANSAWEEWKVPSWLRAPLIQSTLSQLACRLGIERTVSILNLFTNQSCDFTLDRQSFSLGNGEINLPLQRIKSGETSAWELGQCFTCRRPVLLLTAVFTFTPKCTCITFAAMQYFYYQPVLHRTSSNNLVT